MAPRVEKSCWEKKVAKSPFLWVRNFPKCVYDLSYVGGNIKSKYFLGMVFTFWIVINLEKIAMNHSFQELQQLHYHKNANKLKASYK